MKTTLSVIATLLTALLILLGNGYAQTAQKEPTLTIAGHAGEAPLLEVNGKLYIEVQTLARLTQGTLSFKADQTILTLPPSDATVQPSTPPGEPGFSKTFAQLGIEEMSVIREWRSAVVSAVQNNTPVSEDWLSTQHRLAEKGLNLASAAASTDDDRNAAPLLSGEFNNMQKLSDLYLSVRKQAAYISPDTFGGSPLEQQILNCARDFVAMTQNHAFQDQPDCR
jgi:hypothetical protein